MTLARKIFGSQDPEKVVLSTFSGNYTSKDIQARVDRYMALVEPLQLQGKKVGLLVPSVAEYVSLVLAVNALGGTVIPLSWQFRKEDLTVVLQYLDPHVVFSVTVHNGFPFSEAVAAWAKESGKETFLYTSDDCSEWNLTGFAGEQRPLEQEKIDFICCSSGSTGTPKGLVFNLEAFDFSFRLLTDFTELQPTDSVLFYASTSTIFGMKSLTNAIHSGARIVVPTLFDLPRIIKLMQESACNKLVSTPSVFKAIYAFAKQLNPSVLQNIELVGLTGERMTEDFVKQFDLMNHCKFIAQYGISETGAAMACDLRKSMEYTVYEGVQYKIQNDELLLKTPATFSGYYRNPQLTRDAFDEEGWFYTGDLVRLTENNKIEIIGRKKEMIKKGGQQVIPGEVEKVLSEHENVKQAAVIGAPHPVFGEQIVAFVVPDGEVRTEELRAYCTGKIAGYKIPDQFVVMEELPVTQGKTDKITLRKLFQKLHGRGEPLT